MPTRLARHVALLCSAMASTSAFAQESAGSADFEGGDIIVTARKREERAVDVPIAVAAISGERLERRGARNLADVLQEVPGVGIYDSGSALGSKITIRGISSSLGANENGYYLDDLPFTGVTVPLSPDVRAWDLDRIEVLRGPQGTLFGEGSMGGTVRILTKGADLDNWEAKGFGMVSDTRGGGTNAGAKGAFNAPILPGVLAVRVAGTHERYQGWVDNSSTGLSNVNDQTYDTFRARLRFDPTQRLSITGTYWLSTSEFPAGGFNARDDGEQTRGTVPSSRSRLELYGATARYDVGGAELFYSYSHSDFAVPQQGASPLGTIDVSIDIGVEAHELRLASTTDAPLKWTIGGYLRNAQRNDIVKFSAAGIDNDAELRNRTRAVFGEATYTIPGTQLDLTAGLRYFEDRLGGQEANSGEITLQPGDTYKSWNPRFSVAWRPQANTTIYASAAKGFRSGQLQPTVPLALAPLYGVELPSVLRPDTIWTYEVGAKAELWERRLSLEAAVFYSDWEDVTVRLPIPGTTFNGLINSNGTRTKGVELSALLQPLPGLSLAASGAYVDAEYTGEVPGTAIVDGAAVDDVAKFTANASVDYTRAISDTLQAFGRVGWQHTSPRRNSSYAAFLPGDTIDRVDARIGLEFRDVTLALFADNITNENGATSFREVQALGPNIFDITSTRLRPRTIGLEASFHFGGPAR
ncbi:Outer membrane receptor for ferrienterochelin and colicins [Novosphingobium panipatense]|uniref:Outer membrane receptor for ferrienterochelin and colicins n=2 Tax=Novosphingobium panipatense TaxID=428991 RepID=A0ABY1QHC9_9SPHN|nr:Outer membrane receptor for ferrienterochelin and colicins [Novosphingobium panipatense]